MNGSLPTHYRETVCSDCPCRKYVHIKVGNIEQLAEKVLDGGYINTCHQMGYENSKTRCEGFEQLKENINMAGKNIHIFSDKKSLIESHNQSIKYAHNFTLDTYNSPISVELCKH